MTLIKYYEQQCRAGNIQPDDGQMAALTHFQKVLDELTTDNRSRHSLLRRIRKRKLVTGLYVYGGVGIGKTFLMDCFYQNLAFKEKWRIHFHAFMQYIHHELKHAQGKKNPLSDIAKSLAKKYRVICFDEFVVNDIVDAMLLRNLLQALFDNGVCLVATSNTAPNDLYKHGLQRASFLPAIVLLKTHTNVIHLDTKQDYRLMQLQQSGIYFTPDNHHAHTSMEKIFSLLVHDATIDVDPIMILDRPIKIVKRSPDIVWFNFIDICHVPRSQQDYLEITRKFKTVFISHVPVLQQDEKNTIALFIKMIDVFYDARIGVVFSAAAPAEMLGKHLAHVSDYARTQSRIIEMQSEKYFSYGLFNV